MTNAGVCSFRKLSRSWYQGCRLLDALKYGKFQDVVSLVNTCDVDPNIIVPEYGITPMHCAAGIEPEEFGVKCIQELLSIGGDANVKCSEGVTPVHVASCWGKLRVLKILLRYGGDPYLLDNDGRDAFYYAQHSEEVFQFLTYHQDEFPTENTKSPSIDLRYNQDNLRAKLMEADSEDLEISTTALSLIKKHRQGILLFESLSSDEDTSSSTTLETEFNEDFLFEPKDGLIIRDLSESETFKEAPRSDSEICAEDILSSDKTRVIKVINDNVNKSKSRLSIIEISPEFENPTTESCQLKDQMLNDVSTEKTNQQLPLPCVENYEDDKCENIRDKSMEVTMYNTLIKDQSSIGCIDEGLKEEFKEMGSDESSSSQNITRVKMGNCKEECMDELRHETLVGTNQAKKANLLRLDSVKKTDKNIQLPKKVREKLLSFKVNTHYRTRVYKLVSRSCDGLTSKKSLYTSGFEFWSARVKCKSYPCSIRPYKFREKTV